MLKKTLGISILLATLLATTASAKGHGDRGEHGDKFSHGKNVDMVTETKELTATQKESILFMFEEEKVARDVYTTLYEKWGTHIFKNISKSEQKHMDAIEKFINKYEIDSLSQTEEIGEFENETLKALYDELVTKGTNSIVESLEVGVEIEELDIKDLEERIEAGVPSDIEKTYTKLVKASHKHLDSFNSQLGRE